MIVIVIDTDHVVGIPPAQRKQFPGDVKVFLTSKLLLKKLKLTLTYIIDLMSEFSDIYPDLFNFSTVVLFRLAKLRRCLTLVL